MPSHARFHPAQRLASPPKPVAPARFISVDILRGATVALMILVNSPGDPDQVFPPLRHADWNGWTLADLVFPNFLFLVGASSVLSIQSGLFKETPRSTLALRLVNRGARLFALQIALTVFPRTIRPGRISAISASMASSPAPPSVRL